MYLRTTKQTKENELMLRSQILNAAYRLFIENGYYNVTILKIAEEAKVSKNTI